MEGEIGKHLRRAAPKARAAIDHALAVDPDNSEALIVKAQLLRFVGDLEEAERVARRAVDLSPGSTHAIARYSAILQRLGRVEESLAMARRAVELDPHSVTPRHALADYLFFAGKFDEAIVEAQKAIDMVPDDWYGHTTWDGRMPQPAARSLRSRRSGRHSW